MNNDIERVLFTEEQINEKVIALGEQISRDYKDKELTIICVLTGSYIFAADLARAITVPCSIDFIKASSYGSGSSTSGVVKIEKDVSKNPKGRDILVVEDILDTGVTLSKVLEMFKARECNSVKLVALLNKPDRRKVDIKCDYIGFDIENEFVVGYGLDYDEKYRNLPYIGILKREIYSES